MSHAKRARLWRLRMVSLRTWGWPAEILSLLETYLKRQSPPHKSFYSPGLWRFLRWQTMWNRLSESVLREYCLHLGKLQTLRQEPLSAVGQNRYRRQAREWLGFLYRRGFLLQPWHEEIPLLAQPPRLSQRILTYREVCRILSLPSADEPFGLRDRAILEVLYGSGLRSGEMERLSLSDLDLQGKTVSVKAGKTRWGRTVPLTSASVLALHAYLTRGRLRPLRTANEPLWVSQQRGPMMMNHFQFCLNQDYRGQDVPGWSSLQLRDFRRAIATHLLKGGAGVRTVQTFLGHRRLANTQTYLRLQLEDMLHEYGTHHPRFRQSICLGNSLL